MLTKYFGNLFYFETKMSKLIKVKDSNFWMSPIKYGSLYN